jgi:DNA end-binding protein Ku
LDGRLDVRLFAGLPADLQKYFQKSIDRYINCAVGWVCKQETKRLQKKETQMPTQTKASASKTTPAAAARSYKNVVISLGAFTTFPAKLFAAARDESSGFRLAVVKDGTALPVTQLYTADRKEYFPIGMLGRAVEVGDKLMPLTPEELASVKSDTKGKKGIEITKFVPLAQVDPTFFDNSYVIGADTKDNVQAANLYDLLLAVLVKMQKVGQAKMYDRDKEYNVIIRPTFDGTKLMLHTIFTSNEVRNVEVPKSGLTFTDANMSMGIQLVEALSGDFDANDVTSTTDNKVNALIARKTAEATGAAVPPTPEAAPVANEQDSLLAALTASLHAAKVKVVKDEAVTV